MEELVLAKTKFGGMIIDTPGWADSRGYYYSLTNLKTIWNNLINLEKIKTFHGFIFCLKEDDKFDEK